MRRLLSCALLSALLWGCQKTNPHPLDPFEGINREIYGLNKTLDKAIFKPVAYIYWQYLPTPFQMGIGNFYDNLREIPNVANDILQGKFGYAAHDASRFLINSTLGLGGFFNPAGSLGLQHRREDFGQTLYVWGYEESAYIVLPLLGPSTIRDTVGLAVDYYAFSVWPWIHDDEWRYGLLTVDLIDLRARLLRHEAVISTVAVDEYAFIRDAYFQRRQYLVNNEFVNDINSDGLNDIEDPYTGPISSSDAKLEAQAQSTSKTNTDSDLPNVKDDTLPKVKDDALPKVKDEDLPKVTDNKATDKASSKLAEKADKTDKAKTPATKEQTKVEVRQSDAKTSKTSSSTQTLTPKKAD